MSAGQTGMQEIYSNKEYCFSEIRKVREKFGEKSTTFQEYKSMLHGLAYMYLYCPEQIKMIVLAHINELNRRSAYLFGKLPE